MIRVTGGCRRQGGISVNRCALFGISLILSAGAAIGCSSSDKGGVLPPPGWALQTAYFSGTALSGPTSRPAAIATPTDALQVQITWFALEKPASTALDPLSAHVRLISVPGAGDPLRPDRMVAPGARFGALVDDQFSNDINKGAFGRSLQIGETLAALPAGATVTFSAVEPAVGGDNTPRSMTLLVSRKMGATTTPATAPIEFALAIVDRPAEKLESAIDAISKSETKDVLVADKTPSPPAQAVRELSILDEVPVAGATRYGAIVPFHVESPPLGSLVAIIVLSPGSTDAAHASASVAANRGIEQSIAQAGGLASTGGRSRLTLQSALDSMSAGDARTRAALVFLASETGAALCADLALAAGEKELPELASAAQWAAGPILSAGSADAAPIDPQAMGWALDHAAIQACAQLAQNAGLPPEMSAVLSIYGGEAGRHPSALEELSRKVKSWRELQGTLINENLNYLEDVSPSARVRAADWLSTHDVRLPAYDPLGPAKERRRAFEQYLESLETRRQANSGETAAP